MSQHPSPYIFWKLERGGRAPRVLPGAGNPWGCFERLAARSRCSGRISPCLLFQAAAFQSFLPAEEGHCPSVCPHKASGRGHLWAQFLLCALLCWVFFTNTIKNSVILTNSDQVVGGSLGPRSLGPALCGRWEPSAFFFFALPLSFNEKAVMKKRLKAKKKS